MAGIVIIGAGQAGGDLAAALRENGFSGGVTLVGDEEVHPYHRPPLSKGYLLGEKTTSDLLVRSADAYTRHDISVRVGRRAQRVDRDAKVVHLDDGASIQYDALVLATGGGARRHPDSIVDSATNVHYLRSIQDVDRLRAVLTAGRRLLVLGGGYIGLEMASVASRLGVRTTVVEREARVLARVASPLMSDFFQRLHKANGVDVRVDTSVREVRRDPSGAIERVVLDDGAEMEVDACLVAIGLHPNVQLAEEAGLAVQDGVIVDERLRSVTDDAVFAIGDVARYRGENGASHRHESIANATEQARTLAATLCGEPTEHRAVPWFWSDQFDVKYQSVGTRESSDDLVVRGDPHGKKFAAFYLRHGEIHAADVVNSPAEFALAKKLVARKARVDPTVLQDPSAKLRDVLAAQPTHDESCAGEPVRRG